MDAAKIMWVMCIPKLIMAMRVDIRKRAFIHSRKWARRIFYCCAHTVGTGGTLCGCAGVKYPPADYELMPADADMMMRPED